jgi:hypothetical protein
MMLLPEESLSAADRKMMVARSRRLRLLPPTALHQQTLPLWPSPLHAQLEREFYPGA